ncbi:HemK methyltransferase member 2 [Rhizophlyctis rosea]|nr:HemK methyltransferase member 2 [Rhizophlyctis rosea]
MTSSHHPTPDLSHLKYADYRNVYEPAEDTFLLLDALEDDLKFLKDRKPTLCLEVGSGSGCPITFLGTLLGPTAHYLTTDINSHANRATLQTATRNKVSLDTINTHFTTPLLPRIHHAVDVLIFNPPYVVTPSEEVGSHSIEAAWAGGLDGREVIDAFLPLVNVSGPVQFSKSCSEH